MNRNNEVTRSVSDIPWMQRYLSITTAFLAGLYLLTFLLHAFEKSSSAAFKFTPYLLLTTIILVLIPHISAGNFRLIAWFGATGLLIFLLEVIGLESGNLFGIVEFNTSLGLLIIGIPIVLVFNWVLVILGAVTLMERFSDSLWYRLAGVMMITTFYAFIVDQAAVVLSYWEWSSGFAPIQNYVVWALLGGIAAWIYDLLKLSNRKHIQVWIIMCLQLIFFLGLRFS